MSIDVLHVINGFHTGGAERSLANLLTASASGEIRHGVVSLQAGGAYSTAVASAGIPIWDLGMSGGTPSPLALLRLVRIVRHVRPKILQGWMYHSNLAASLSRLATTFRPKLAWNIRQTLDGLQQEKPMTRWVIRAHRLTSPAVDAIIYNCELSRQQHENQRFPHQRGAVIANGVDTQVFRPDAAARERVRRDLGIPYGATVVGHAARYHRMKDHAGFLNAAARTARSIPSVHFLLAGPGVDPGNAALVNCSRGAADNVHLIGERHDMPDVFAATDLVCSSSAWGEGFPNVIAEAMACGVSCIATSVGASDEIIADTGRLVAPRDPDALANAMIGVLQLQEGDRRRLGERGRQRILEHYSLDTCLSNYQALYARLVDA